MRPRWFLVSFLLFLPASALAQPAPVVSAACVGDQLLVASPGPRTFQGLHGIQLIRGWADPRDAEASWGDLRVPHEPLARGNRGGVSKVCVRRDHLWFVTPGDANFHVVPLDDLQHLEASRWAAERRERKFGGRAVGVGSPFAYWVENLLFPCELEERLRLARALDSPDRPKNDFSPRPNFMDYTAKVVREAHYDLIPTGGDTALLVQAGGGTAGFREVVLGTP
ncbi:MAG: hypothetical protein K2V38_27240, partial [Gemmataceae bacterium]|nr:hypothetical protein [Gemmataceae bacterium]